MTKERERFLPAKTREFKDFGFMQAYLSFKLHLPPKRRSFGSLVTIDDAVLKPRARGFGLHPHKDMEVLTFMFEGEVYHIDPNEKKHTGLLKAKGVQIITAGTGIIHNEENNSHEEEMRALQIWFLPREKNLNPNYAQAHLKEENYLNKLSCVLSPDGRDNSLIVQQDVFMLYSKVERENNFSYQAQGPERKLFIYMVEGGVVVGDYYLNKGDGYGLMRQGGRVQFRAAVGAEFVLFDLGP